MLHLEIITERLRREFDLNLIVTTPTITYEVTYSRTKKTETIYSPALFPNDGETSLVREPWIDGAIITPPEYMGPITQLLYEHEAEMGDTDIFGDKRYKLEFKMPLRELMRGFFDKSKACLPGLDRSHMRFLGTAMQMWCVWIFLFLEMSFQRFHAYSQGDAFKRMQKRPLKNSTRIFRDSLRCSRFRQKRWGE